MSNLAIIILAAGKGTRMKSDLPKVMHKVAGRHMLAHVVTAAKELQPQKIIVVLPPDSEDISSKIKDCEIAIQNQQLGTADAVKSAIPYLKGFDGNVLILYGDCPLITSSSIIRLIEKPINNEIRIFGFEASKPAKYGRLITSKNIVREVVEFKDASEAHKKITLCNSGIYYLAADMLEKLIAKVTQNNAQHEYYLTDIIKLGWKDSISTIYIPIDEDEISGVNDRAELAKAEAAMQKRLRARALSEGVTLLSSKTIYLSSDTKFGRDVTIRPNVVIDEKVIIGDNVTIGPFAHLRPGAIIGNHASIGNFVEIKKSTIGDGSKINHLSYIGDSTLGINVNIGAGVITCNYDGYTKHETKIGDGVFVGSNSALVAPIEIGNDALIAAGSVISKNVPSGALGIARSLQKNLADWAMQFRKDKKK